MMAVGVRWVGWVAGMGLCVAGLGGCPTSTDCADPRNAETCGKEKVEVLVTVSAPVARMRAGEKAELSATLERKGEWPSQGEVTLSASELVGGVTMEPVQVAANAAEATLEFAADAAVPQGAFAFKLVATPVDNRIPAAEAPLEAVVPGPPGTLDLSFGSDGVIEYETQGVTSTVSNIAVDDRHRILVAGYQKEGAEAERPLLLRFDGQGDVDSDFVTNAKSVTAEAESTHYADVIWLDGRIISVGWHPVNDEDATVMVALVGHDDSGMMDRDFTQGLFAAMPGWTDGVGIKQSEGLNLRILRQETSLKIMGSAKILSYSHGGILDDTFGQEGIIGVGLRQIFPPISLPSDELIWIGGPFKGSFPPEAVQITASGTAEPMEGYLAELVAQNELLAGTGATVKACDARTEGQTLCVGIALPEGQGAFVVQLNAYWNLDTNFASGGRLLRIPLSDITKTTNIAVRALNDEMFVVIEHETENETDTLYLARYNPDGSIDAAFGEGGRVVVESSTFIYDERFGQLIFFANSDGTIVLTRYWL